MVDLRVYEFLKGYFVAILELAQIKLRGPLRDQGFGEFQGVGAHLGLLDVAEVVAVYDCPWLVTFAFERAVQFLLVAHPPAGSPAHLTESVLLLCLSCRVETDPEGNQRNPNFPEPIRTLHPSAPMSCESLAGRVF